METNVTSVFTFLSGMVEFDSSKRLAHYASDENALKILTALWKDKNSTYSRLQKDHQYVLKYMTAGITLYIYIYI